jgi:hypothetical protein
MSINSSVVVLGLIALSLPAAMLPAEKMYSGVLRSDENERQGADTLTHEEAGFIRTVIYDEHISTRYTTGTSAHREVVLRPEVVELHKKKRVGTIKLLLDIVKGGKPKDALAAGVTAYALEEGPVYAICLLDGTSESFDKADSDDEPTKRERIVKKLEKILASVEK